MLQVNRKNPDSDKDTELLVNMKHDTAKRSEESVIRRLENNNFNVQEHILLLLSQVAPLIPDKVLEHVLIMFVFVGNKLARKDDSYSFQIISQTIKTILPAIVNSSHLNNNQPADPRASGANSSCRLSKTVNIMQRHQKQLPYVSSLGLQDSPVLCRLLAPHTCAP